MTFVVDASVALKWFLITEADAGIAAAIVRDGGHLMAPDIVIAEVCNAAWKSARLGIISRVQLDEIASELPRFFGVLAGAADLASRAVVIASQLDHPVNDALYLALAEREQAQLITADSRLIAKIRGTVWQGHATALADYPAKT